jgi:hypothetical protein
MTGINMAPAETSREVRGLSQHGQQLGTDWGSAKSAIAGNEGGIGTDVLGQAFRGVYLPDSTAVRGSADKVPDAIMTDASLGNQAVGDYGATDGGAASDLGAVGGR